MTHFKKIRRVFKTSQIMDTLFEKNSLMNDSFQKMYERYQKEIKCQKIVLGI